MHKNSGFKGTFTCSNCPIYQKSNYFMISILNKTKKHLSDSNLLPSPFKKFRGKFRHWPEKYIPAERMSLYSFCLKRILPPLPTVWQKDTNHHTLCLKHYFKQNYYYMYKKDLNDFKKSLNYVQNISFVFPFSLIIVRNSKQYMYFK